MPPPVPGIPQRHHDNERVKQATSQPAAEQSPVATGVVHVDWGGVKLALPMSLVTAVVTAMITHWASPSSLPADDELRGQVREIAADVRELKQDRRELRDSLAVERAYTRRNLPLMATVIEHGCSAKFAWQDGRRPAEPDWLPQPANGAAPQWQPAEALLAPPVE